MIVIPLNALKRLGLNTWIKTLDFGKSMLVDQVLTELQSNSKSNGLILQICHFVEFKCLELPNYQKLPMTRILEPGQPLKKLQKCWNSYK